MFDAGEELTAEQRSRLNDQLRDMLARRMLRISIEKAEIGLSGLIGPEEKMELEAAVAILKRIATRRQFGEAKQRDAKP